MKTNSTLVKTLSYVAVSFGLALGVRAELAGSGKEGDPYRLSSVEDLQAWAAGAYANDAFYKVTADITIDAETAATLLPLYPTAGAKFAGTFDGGNHKITYTLAATDTRTAFFGHAQNATFKNVCINGTITSDVNDCYCGIFLSTAYGQTFFENITTEGSISGSKLKNVAGVCVNEKGLAENVTNYITFNNCTNKANLATAYTKAGGILGYAEWEWYHDERIVFSGCCNEGAITRVNSVKDGWVGGICGWVTKLEAVAFTNCYNTGTLCATQSVGTANTIAIGGMLGCMSDTRAGFAFNIVGCSNAANIIAVDSAATGKRPSGVGGLIGYWDGSAEIAIEGCSNSGVVQYGTNEGVFEVTSLPSIGSLVGFSKNASAITRKGTVTAQASMAPVGVTPCNAYAFATVDGGTATFVTPEAGGSYKVMLAGAAFELATADATIALDETLANATVTVAAELAADYNLKHVGNLYSLEPKAPIPVPTEDTPEAVSNALANAGIPADNAIYGVVTSKSDMENLNALMKTNGVAAVSGLSSAQMAHLADSFLMSVSQLLAGDDANHLFANATEITVAAFAASDANWAITIRIRDGEDALKIAAANLAGKVQKSTGLPNWDAVEAKDITVTSGEGTDEVTLTVAPPSSTIGFLRVNVAK